MSVLLDDLGLCEFVDSVVIIVQLLLQDLHCVLSESRRRTLQHSRRFTEQHCWTCNISHTQDTSEASDKQQQREVSQD